jgi:hypothetical protein
MLRKLLIVFASGVILSIVAFAAAWVVGGSKLHRDIVKEGGWEWTIGEDGAKLGPTTTRNFPVEPGARLAMEIPVELTFTRGDKAGMEVTGPKRLVDNLTWENGHLGLKNGSGSASGIRVRITAPEINGLDLEAPGNVTLTDLDQDKFALRSEGAIDLDATGKVRQLSITSLGAGSIDVGQVQAEDAIVRIDGVGDVTVGASNLVDVQINGAGNVTVVRKPKTLRSRIIGLGSVDRDY